jgi:transcriptional regulator with XRE-family HTH domain
VAIAVKVKELRMKKGLSLQQVADGVGSSKAHIWEIETGKNKNPSIDSLNKLADFFEVSVTYLIGEDPNSEGEEPELVAMFRELKGLSESDRNKMREIMKVFKKER